MLDPQSSSRVRVVNIVGQILAKRAISQPVLADADLRDLGLTSLDMVNLMLSVEAEFDIQIPDSHMTPANFRTISGIEKLVNLLLAGK